jgi:hypothetical protein
MQSFIATLLRKLVEQDLLLHRAPQGHKVKKRQNPGPRSNHWLLASSSIDSQLGKLFNCSRPQFSLLNIGDEVLTLLASSG